MRKFLYSAGCGILALGSALYAVNTASHAPSVKASDTDGDYTSYITNPSFESYTATDANKVTSSSDGLRGWKVENPDGWAISNSVSLSAQLEVTADCYSDNNFGQLGTIADGTYALYLRMGWSNGNTQLTQTLKSLPSGEYTLSYNYKALYANSATSSFFTKVGDTTSSTITFTAGSAGSMKSLGWQKANVSFTNKEDGDVDLLINIDWISGGSCIALDNFNLVRNGDYIPSTEEEPEIGDSPTEGVITHDFVEEAQMKTDLLKMLAKFTTYMSNNVYTIADTNSEGDAMICFKGENTLGNDEKGVRPNADMSMICACLVKYGKEVVALPTGISWQDVEDMAKKSLVYAYSTHKANKLYTNKNSTYWGSTSTSDYTWESSLWAMSVAYSAFFQWDNLTETQKGHIEKMLVAECNYELGRSIPTGYQGDTKAEENGWEADILAATLGLFPNHEDASKWFDRLREFAINSYSHSSDAEDNTVIDPKYDNKTVADLYIGQNLYDDYTLQNHNLFHTSYQNVVMQELGEAALALKLFQTGLYGEEKWKTNALMHNNQEVMDEVLNWLALADGELAMPNGNDWSLFLFDQITSYSTMACFLKDPNALFLENMAYKYIQARQKTTDDGSWLLRADVGGRRMGVEGHRVMMTYLMHEALSTADITPSTWNDFMTNYGKTKYFPCQNVIRSSSDSRFTTFSWSSGLSSYTGYIASQNADNNKIIVPYRANKTGNFLGWYTVSGKSTDATPVVSGIYEINDDSYVMNGELNVNGASLNNRFAIYSTPGNAVIYLDLVRANTSATITKEQGGLMAISMDEFTKTKRDFFTEDHTDGKTLDGITFTKFDSDWANIDNELGFVALGNKGMAFGDRENNNSIMTAKIYPLYSEESRTVAANDIVDARNVIYYTSIDAATTKSLRDKSQNLSSNLPEGWNGVIAADPDGAYFLLLSNFTSMETASLKDITTEAGAPVFSVETTIADDKSSASFIEQLNNSHADVLKAFVKGANVVAVQDAENPEVIYILNDNNESVNPNVTIISAGNAVSGKINIKANETVKVSVVNGAIVSETSEMPKDESVDLAAGYNDITTLYLSNPSFEKDETYGTITSATVGSTTYDQCYVNEVDPIDANVPNILPVVDWTNETNLESTDGNRPYRRMYSMPYSTSLVCASVKGNYTDSCSPYLSSSTTTGKRCLTVLNSWANGVNKITHSSDLVAGGYRILIDAKYVCANETSNDGSTVLTSGGNTLNSLIGVKYNSTEEYKYPASAGQWETLVYDFTLDNVTPVTISLGYEAVNVMGAANQTLLYLDNVRILQKESTAVGVSSTISNPSHDQNIYSLNGVLVRKAGEISSTPLPSGIYIKGSKKIIVR